MLISEYKLDQAIAVLILGESGTGKTNFCFEWPDPLIIDGDGNCRNAIERHPGKRGWIHVVDTDESGQSVPDELRWKRCCAILEREAPKPEVRTIVMDGLSKLSMYCKAYIISQGAGGDSKDLIIGGEKMMTKSHWNPFQHLISRFITQARSYGKPFILTGHLKSERDISDLLISLPAIQGQLDMQINGFFTDVWQTDILFADPRTGTPLAEPLYVIRTGPTPRLKLKCSCGLPPCTVFNWAGFEKLQAKRKADRDAAGGAA